MLQDGLRTLQHTHSPPTHHPHTTRTHASPTHTAPAGQTLPLLTYQNGGTEKP
jgi:hypothetical protein